MKVQVISLIAIIYIPFLSLDLKWTKWQLITDALFR